jgi:hypothetical protein
MDELRPPTAADARRGAEWRAAVHRENVRNQFIEGKPDGPHRLPVTEWAVAMVQPHEWNQIADFLHGLLTRPPIAHSPYWAAHRIVLGALVSELRMEAAEAGEPLVLDVEEVEIRNAI